MNREIKFRFWDNIAKQMMPQPRVWVDMAGLVAAEQNHHSLIILQYAGLKDKNGKEIYEGDIVKYQYAAYEHDIRDASGEVFFEDGMFLFDRDMEFAMNDSNFIEESLEIIGNIYEN